MKTQLKRLIPLVEYFIDLHSILIHFNTTPKNSENAANYQYVVNEFGKIQGKTTVESCWPTPSSCSTLACINCIVFRDMT